MTRKAITIVGVGLIAIMLLFYSFHVMVSPAIPYSTKSDGTIVHK